MVVIKKHKLSTIVIFTFFAISFLVISIFNIFGLAIIFLLFLIIVFSCNKVNLMKIHLKNEDIHIIFLFYLPFFASLSTVSFISLFTSGLCPVYIEFYVTKIGRMINVSIFFALFLFTVNERNNNRISTKTLFNAYVAGCCVLLFFGIWQIFNFLFGLPYPDFYTRDHIHSMDADFLIITRRVTSIAREPAFLVPYLLDATIIIFYVLKKYYLLILFAVVLLFTLSLSAYINFFLVLIVMIYLARKTMKGILVKVLVFICCICVLYLWGDIFFIVFQRLNPADLFLSERLQNSTLSIRYMFYEAPIFNLLFGFGPRGMSYIRNFTFYVSGWRQGEMIDNTTHIIFVDFLVEHGIIGMLIIGIMFYYLFKLATRVFDRTGNRLGQVLCLNLLISSFYTADYASPRFTVIILLLLCIYKDSGEKRVGL